MPKSITRHVLEILIFALGVVALDWIVHSIEVPFVAHTILTLMEVGLILTLVFRILHLLHNIILKGRAIRRAFGNPQTSTRTSTSRGKVSITYTETPTERKVDIEITTDMMETLDIPGLVSLVGPTKTEQKKLLSNEGINEEGKAPNINNGGG